jgi:hypothetical protein
MDDVGAAQQPSSPRSITQEHRVYGGSRELLRLPLQGLCGLKFDATTPTGLSPVEQCAADRTVLHEGCISRLKVEQQVGQLLPRVREAGAIALIAAIPDGLDQIDELGTILLSDSV